MPETLVVPKTDGGFPDVAKHNAEIAQKLAAQDIMGQETNPNPDAHSGDELDRLAREAEEAAKNPPEPPEKETPAPEPDPKATAEKAAEDAKAEEERQAAQKKADEYFKDSPALPPNASPKSSEAFSAIKLRAAQDIAERDAKLEKLAKDKAELEQRLQNQPPPEALKELEEHRQWRAKLDVEADPKFKEFDRQVASSSEFIYAQLLKSPNIDKAVIDDIKKYGGPDKVNMAKIFSVVDDPMTESLVKAKLADIAVARYEKDKAVAAAKENIVNYIKEREQQVSQQAVQHNQATQTRLVQHLAKLDWFTTKEVPAGADKEVRKAIEEDNAFVLNTRQELADALKDDSAEMRAVMLTGMAQLFKLQRELPAVSKERDALKAQVKELEDKLTAIKNASKVRIREGGAQPGTGSKVGVKPVDQFNTHAGEALDTIMKQFQEERERVNK